MRRRTFIAALGGAAVWPLVAQGQQPGAMRLIGVLWAVARTGHATALPTPAMNARRFIRSLRLREQEVKAALCARALWRSSS